MLVTKLDKAMIVFIKQRVITSKGLISAAFSNIHVCNHGLFLPEHG